MSAEVDVCICTCRRPEMLRSLLDSLRAQKLPDFTCRIVIVDNDANASAKAVADAFEGPLNLIYHVEPKPGLAHARNTALSLTTAPLVAFIDDDEVAPPFWLATLRQALLEHDADIIVGPVRPVFQEDAPAWVVNHPLFNLPTPPTGTRTRSGATGNVVLRRASFGDSLPTFDPAFGLTGGEDTDFFHRAHLAGKKLIHCREAYVFETVPAERTELGWLTRRSFRTGRGFSQILVSRWSLPRRLGWYGLKLFQLIAAAPLLPVLRLLSYERYALLLTRVYAALGHLSVPFGYAPPTGEYAHLHRP